jgi:hypothetical protein
LQRCVIRIVDYLYENDSKAWSNWWHNWNSIKPMTIWHSYQPTNFFEPQCYCWQ